MQVMRYDDAVAELYQVPIDRFVAERKRLAGELKAAGDKDGAARLAKLARPPISAWAVDQLWWRARDGFDALFADHRGLGRVFTRQVRKLEGKPVVTTVKPAQGGGNRANVALDGGALVNWLVAKALATPSFATVPAEIRQLAAGRPQAIAADRASVTPPGFIGYGLVYGVACSEWVPYEPASRILPVGRRAFPRYPDSVLAQPPQFTY